MFVGYPWLAAIVGAGFILLGWAKQRRGVIGVGLVWTLYAAYETGMQQRWLCSGECNIRVDLLLIYPVLLLASGWALWRLLRGKVTT